MPVHTALIKLCHKGSRLVDIINVNTNKLLCLYLFCAQKIAVHVHAWLTIPYTF